MKINILLLVIIPLVLFSSCREEEPGQTLRMQLLSAKIGQKYLVVEEENSGIPVDQSLIITFSTTLDTATISGNVILECESTGSIDMALIYRADSETFEIVPNTNLVISSSYSLEITNGIKGKNGASFPGVRYHFTTEEGVVTIESATINGQDLQSGSILLEIDRKQLEVNVSFSKSLDPLDYLSYFSISPDVSLNASISKDCTEIVLSNTDELVGWKKYYFNISNSLKSASGSSFDGFSKSFFTSIDSSLKFPLLSDDELLTLVQQQTFRYFWDFAHPTSGMTRDRNTSGDIVTTGGSGFGVMALIVGMENRFITREEGIFQLDKILGFLESCDRYHGAWPHWLNGRTGSTIPFTTYDDGAELVETSYMIQGLLTMRQYLNSNNALENTLIERINALCDSVEYDWFTRGENALYWHWSPNYDWKMNMKIQGYNETLITYLVAATSVTHPISASVYTSGYTRNGSITNGNSFFGYVLPLGSNNGDPMFFTHYSFLGLDPRNLQDNLASYWQQNVNLALIDWSYCIQNPKKYAGYNSSCWGLTASDNPWGYSAHSPNNDLGVITPTAAISSLPYTPEQSMKALRFFYYILGDKLWGDYGFYDAFNITENWWANSYLAIDQGPIICMIENYNTGLLWDLFMSCPEVQNGLTKLGFTY